MVKQNFKIFVLAAFLVASVQTSAFASSVNFVNYSGSTISSLYVFREGSWHYLNGTLYDGKAANVYVYNVSRESNLRDIKVNFSGGRTICLTGVDFYSYRKITICQNSNSSSGFRLYLEK